MSFCFDKSCDCLKFGWLFAQDNDGNMSDKASSALSGLLGTVDQIENDKFKAIKLLVDHTRAGASGPSAEVAELQVHTFRQAIKLSVCLLSTLCIQAEGQKILQSTKTPQELIAAIADNPEFIEQIKVQAIQFVEDAVAGAHIPNIDGEKSWVRRQLFLTFRCLCCLCLLGITLCSISLALRCMQGTFTIADVQIKQLKIPPSQLTVVPARFFHNYTKNALKNRCEQTVEEDVAIAVHGLQLGLKDFNFTFDKSTFPKLADVGQANARASGLKIDIRFEIVTTAEAALAINKLVASVELGMTHCPPMMTIAKDEYHSELVSALNAPGTMEAQVISAGGSKWVYNKLLSIFR